MLEMAIRYTVGWGVLITAAAALGAVVITNLFNRHSEERRSTATRKAATDALEREDELRRDATAREDRLRFLENRRELYVRFQVAASQFAMAATTARIQVSVLLVGPDGIDEARKAEANLHQAMRSLRDVLAEVDLLGPLAVRHAAVSVEWEVISFSLAALGISGAITDRDDSKFNPDQYSSALSAVTEKADALKAAARADLGLQ